MITINTAQVFKPLLEPSRYKAVYGGRGGGKSHHLAEQMVRRCMLNPGTRAVCIREIQRTLAQSSKRLIEDKIQALGVGSHFHVFHDRIETSGAGVILFRGMQDSNAESIKSLEACTVAWIEEAQTLSHRSLALLRPTIRAEGSEIWASWNPRRKSDAIDEFFRGGESPDNAVVIKYGWRHNPWWTAELESERQLDRKRYPDRYSHIWEGDYARAFEGAYFSTLLAEAAADGRIGEVAADPIIQLRGFWDIGGSGAQSDATSIWIVQWTGQQIRVLDYIEGVGQTLSYYVNELRARGCPASAPLRQILRIEEGRISGSS